MSNTSKGINNTMALKMYRILAFFLGLYLILPVASAQELSVHWAELTAPEFVQALDRAGGVCLLPFGVIEKHGPAGPLGTDLISVRYATVAAAEQEYAIVFPEYYFGQIFEAEHQPGTISYSRRLQLELLQETVAEMGRNGCTKVVIVNGHGGNTHLINYFTQTQIDKPKDYVVYALMRGRPPAEPDPAAAPSREGVDGHGGESELAMLMAARPDLVYPERSPEQSGANQARLQLPDGVSTAIWWYASYPNHYMGDSAGANETRGRVLMNQRITHFVEAIRGIKADEVAPRLQREFFEQVARPIETQQ